MEKNPIEFIGELNVAFWSLSASLGRTVWHVLVFHHRPREDYGLLHCLVYGYLDMLIQSYCLHVEQASNSIQRICSLIISCQAIVSSKNCLLV
jgi:hypothetical protein